MKHSVIATGSATLQRRVNVRADLFYWFQLPFSLSLPLGHSNLAELQLTGWPPTSLGIQWQRLMTAVTRRGRRGFSYGSRETRLINKSESCPRKKKSKDEQFRHHFTPDQWQPLHFHFKTFSCCPPNFQSSIFQDSHICSKKMELVNLNKDIIMLFNLKSESIIHHSFLKTLQPSETLIWPQFLGKLCSRWEYYWFGSRVEKARIGLMCLVFPSTWIKSGKKAVLFGVLLTSATSLQHRHTHANDELCVTAKTLPGSGWGLGGGHARPWELQDTGGKMCGARQRCGEPRVETEA